MPYHLPDDDVIGNCVIKFSIPSDEKWATVIIGAISELGRAENWEEGTGTISIDEAIETATLIVESVGFQAC